MVLSGEPAASRATLQRPAICVATGTLHQGQVGQVNAQCVGISACAAIYSTIKRREVFTTDEIDMLLFDGNNLYTRAIAAIRAEGQFQSDLLYREQLPTDIRVGNYLANIKVINLQSWVANGLLPNRDISELAAIIDLEFKLTTEAFNDRHNDINDSFFFTTLNNTTSFWRYDNKFYVFNSHGVDDTNRHNSNDRLNFARLFCSDNAHALATFLIKTYNYNNYGSADEYSIERISVDNYSLITSTNLNSTEPTLELGAQSGSFGSENLPSHLDPKLSILQPVVVLENIRIDIKTTEIPKKGRPPKRKYFNNKPAIKTTLEVDPKLSMIPVVVLSQIDIVNETQLGRPQKQLRGPKKIKENAHLLASKIYNEKNPAVHREAVKKYTIINPEVNRNAVKTYAAKKPEIHRIAVKTYAVNNPQIHRDAVQRYSQNNPEINTASVQTYNAVNRNLEPQLRSSTLIAQKRGDDLDVVQLYSLKKTSLLSLDVHVCLHCRARLFFEEKARTQWCCGGNTFNVLGLEPLHEEFYSHPSFLNKPRAYNNLFSFSALGVSHGYQQPNTGISFLKIQGRVYHSVFDLNYSGRFKNPLDYYIHDSNERESVSRELCLDIEVIRSITNFMHNVNPYIDCFKRLSRETAQNAHIVFEHTSRRSHGNILGDLPVGKEVAAIIRTEVEESTPHCIAIWREGRERPHTVDLLHPLYESFQYPLLYPHGNPGWCPEKLDKNGRKLSQLKYVRCLLLSEQRFSEFNRLSEEWIIDMFSRISEERLRYIRNAQSSNSSSAARSAPLSEIQTPRILMEDETISGGGNLVQGRVYLPYTFTSGPRYFKQKYLDSIALVHRLGQPSFFITITCNPKWIEIKNSVPSGQKTNPLVCARVFNLKLAQLIRDIRSGHWFGKCIYIMYVVEFQKRGLPHAHICFRVEGGGPIQSIEIDKFVRADIPNPSEAQGRLRKVVLDHMIHGPCGISNRTDLPCWDGQNNKCTKFFPKNETPVTFCDDRGFVNLKRNSLNDAEIKYRGRTIQINDRWVVPYNAALLLKYDCHINVEVSSATAVVKYLFKYITKGTDHSRVTVVADDDDDRNDEIVSYVTKRYLGSCEATWRVLEFDLVRREPNVKQLAVHLEGQQYVYFKTGNETEAANRATSDLITYFNRPAGSNFDNLTYTDFFENYIVHASRPPTKNVEIFATGNNRFITKRQRGELVARLFFVAPNRGEQFYLRLLLASYPCRGYKDLLNLGGSSCTTFQEAARTVGLANDEAEYEKAMAEACAYFTGPRLRSFFVLLAVNGIPVASLWTKFRDQISEDFLYRQPDDIESAYESCLVAIDRILRRHGTSLIEQGLPNVVDTTTELGREQTEYRVNHLKDFVNDWLPKLSPDQKSIFDYVNKLVTDQQFRETNDRAIFIDGPGGTGKTLLLNVITAHVRANLNGVVLCTASSGIAAQNYENGTTAHSMFRLPLNLVDDLGYWNLTNGSQRANLIFNSQLIIFDEAPMAHKWLIHLLERSLRDLMQSNQIFGGKIIIFSGDYRQIPPVVIDAKTPSDIFNASVKSSPVWHRLKTFSLATAQRCSADPEFSEFLLKLGSNRLTPIAVNSLNLLNLSMISFVTELDDLIDFVFPSVVIDEPDVCVHRSILTTHNANVREINAKILDRLPEDPLHFYSVDELVTDDADQVFFGPDALNRMHPKGLPEHDLILKIGAVCMIIRNLNFADKLLNGTKVIVVKTSPRLITVRKSGISDGYLIPRILFKAPVAPGSPIEMYRRQFPLQVSYAMTIHKSQGQTISRVGVDLRSDVFSHGQLYVALSRVQSRQSIKLLLDRDRVINGDPLANNVIYPPLL